MTISLENAKKLYETAKKFGVKLPSSEYSYFYRVRQNYLDKYRTDEIMFLEPNTKGWCWARTGRIGIVNAEKYIPAPTTDELLEWLMEKIQTHSSTTEMEIGILISNYSEVYLTYYKLFDSDQDTKIYIEAKTPADALCKLVIKLIEEGVIK